MTRSQIRPTFATLMVAAALLALALPAAASGAVRSAPRAPARSSARAGVGARSSLAGPAGPARSARLPKGERQACPPSSTPGVMSCQAIVRTGPGSGRDHAAGSKASPLSQYGYAPADLRSAYGLTADSARDGRGETVAIVDADSDPDLAADLATYRRLFGLRPCSVATGCLRILNQDGQDAPLPPADAGWAFEESVDAEMISAICPNCRIVVIEARSPTIQNLGLADQAAAAGGARFINNSWAGAEFPGETTFDHYFNHPGDAVTAAAGDYGYAVEYPAASQYVTAVGGTSLYRDRHVRRGWRERAWGTGGIAGREGSLYYLGTGSGCSMLEAKPSWQRERVDDTAAGCLNRTVSDVSADADPTTGAAVYDTYDDAGQAWQQTGGTSVATAIITGTYALAGDPAPRTYPASYLYRHPRDLNDVTGGNNGTCEASRRYLCWGVRGYDGPTGLGTPRGDGAFSDHGGPAVTLTDPGPSDVAAGARFRLRIVGLDARRRAAGLEFSAAGLPAGLSIRATPGSTDAVVAGALPAAPVTTTVTVTARDVVTGQTGSVRFMIVSVRPVTRAGIAGGFLSLHESGLCLDAGSGVAGSAASLRACTAGPGQRWTFTSGAAPGSAGTLSADGLCLGWAGRQLVLLRCTAGAPAQGWTLPGYGMLRNDRARRCLAVGAASAGQRAGLGACIPTADTSWTLPAGLLVAGSGLCADAPGGDDIPVQVHLARCAATRRDEQITVHADDGVVVGGDCFDVPGPSLVGSTLDGQQVIQNFCSVQFTTSQQWLAGPHGELINNYSGKCLDAPGVAGSGLGLIQEDCYGLPGEIWAVN
jgi:Ricin-type beta-trefoil lectin domain/Subtilase family